MALIKTYTGQYSFEARAEFATLEEAQAFAASFPKSYLVKARGYFEGGAFASIHYALKPQHGNDFNEVGAQRATRFMDKAEKLGHTIKHVR